MWQAKGTLLLMHFSAIIYKFFSSTMLQKLLKWTPVLSQSYFCLWIASCSLQGNSGWDLLHCLESLFMRILSKREARRQWRESF